MTTTNQDGQAQDQHRPANAGKSVIDDAAEGPVNILAGILSTYGVATTAPPDFCLKPARAVLAEIRANPERFVPEITDLRAKLAEAERTNASQRIHAALDAHGVSRTFDDRDGSVTLRPVADRVNILAQSGKAERDRALADLAATIEAGNTQIEALRNESKKFMELNAKAQADLAAMTERAEKAEREEDRETEAAAAFEERAIKAEGELAQWKERAEKAEATWYAKGHHDGRNADRAEADAAKAELAELKGRKVTTWTPEKCQQVIDRTTSLVEFIERRDGPDGGVTMSSSCVTWHAPPGLRWPMTNKHPVTKRKKWHGKLDQWEVTDQDGEKRSFINTPRFGMWYWLSTDASLPCHGPKRHAISRAKSIASLRRIVGKKPFKPTKEHTMARKNTKTIKPIMPKPCPFCGTANMDSLDGEQPGLEVVVMPHAVSWVKCNICEMEGPPVNSKSGDGAVKLWNDRKSP